MQDDVMQLQSQPFMKLAQANMELLTQFSTSPEVASQASANASQMFQQSTESFTKLMQSGAFAHMMQGMLKNYTEFLSDLSQSWVSMMSQGQQVLARQAQEATDGVLDAVEVPGRRARRSS